jgi:hypothetical protein
MICTPDSVDKAAKKYDIIIAGSDQIWNPDFSGDVKFFLPFPTKTLSYAASVGKAELQETELEFIGENMKYLTHVSVREQRDEERFQKYRADKIQTVLDPTLLLTREQWMAFIDNVKMSDDFKNANVFYILGDFEKYVPLVDRLLSEGKKVVVISPWYNMIESKYKYNNHIVFVHSAGPREFLNLIRNGDRIYTDSFHATVFSYIFEKQFVVFPKGDMNERILTLLKTINLKSQFLTVDAGQFPDIDYQDLRNEFEEKREESMNWLKDCLLQ